MARRSPLKKRVMSSTNSTPWQEVKSNCKTQGGVSTDLPILHSPPQPSTSLFQEAFPDPVQPSASPQPHVDP